MLAQDLTIQLAPDFRADPNDASVPMQASDFVAELNLADGKSHGHWAFDRNAGEFTWQSDNISALPLFVESVDNDAKTVTLKFRGAPSGDYLVLLSSRTLGRLDTENLSIKTEAFVTSITP